MLRLSSLEVLGLALITFFLSLYMMPFLAFRGIQPDLWIVLILFYAFRVNWKRVPAFAMAVGCLRDLLSVRVFGVEIFALGVSALLLSYVVGKIERELAWILLASAFLFSLFYDLLRLGTVAYFSAGFELEWLHVARSAATAFYSTAVLLLAFSLFELLTGTREFRWDHEWLESDAGAGDR